MSEQLLTLEEVAEYLNVDRVTVYRLLTQKELPAFKVGNQWRFKREMIEAWLMENANGRQKLPHQGHPGPRQEPSIHTDLNRSLGTRSKPVK